MQTDNLSNLLALKRDLVKYYKWLRQYGLNDSHSGNASIRDGDDVWVTPKGANADTLESTELILCNLDGTILEGASLDAPLHVQIYQKNPKINAVFHSHNPHTLAITLDGVEFEPLDFEGKMYFERVPLINIATEDYFSQSPRKVSNTLQRYKACVVKGHGVYAGGQTLNMAYKWICSLEHSAKIATIHTQYTANKLTQDKK